MTLQKSVSKGGFLHQQQQKKVTNLEGHIAVEGPCRLDAEWAGQQGSNSQQVSLAHSHVLLKAVLRVVVAATLATPVSRHQSLAPIHFHLLKPATWFFDNKNGCGGRKVETGRKVEKGRQSKMVN